MVAEKPSLAQSLAEILSNKQCNSRKGNLYPIWVFCHLNYFKQNHFLRFKFSNSFIQYIGIYKIKNIILVLYV